MASVERTRADAAGHRATTALRPSAFRFIDHPPMLVNRLPPIDPPPRRRRQVRPGGVRTPTVKQLNRYNSRVFSACRMSFKLTSASSERITIRSQFWHTNANTVWHQRTCVTNYVDRQTLNPDDDYVLPHQRLWMFDALVCALSAKSVSCRSRSSVEQSSIARHLCPLSFHLLLSS